MGYDSDGFRAQIAEVSALHPMASEERGHILVADKLSLSRLLPSLFDRVSSSSSIQSSFFDATDSSIAAASSCSAAGIEVGRAGITGFHQIRTICRAKDHILASTLPQSSTEFEAIEPFSCREGG
jgi:hypothetical protein